MLVIKFFEFCYLLTIEPSKFAFLFSTRDWVWGMAAVNGKNRIVLGLESTGHYWLGFATWMISNGIGLVKK